MSVGALDEDSGDALFDVPAPPIRRGGAGYLARLGTLHYRDEILPEGWQFWALAPIEKQWTQPGVVTVEHVWLVHSRHLYQALVDVGNGEILRRRQHGTT